LSVLTRRSKWWISVAVLLLLGAVIGFQNELISSAANYLLIRVRGGYTVGERVREYGDAVAMRLKPGFDAAALSYPPGQVAYLAFKDTATLEVYARAVAADEWRRVATYPILQMSGGPGPKIRRGDRQVPEGIYRAEFLNANSRFHLSIRLNFPNAFDVAQAKADLRTDVGSDIMIHGTSASIGCLAMGNQTAEDLFVLAALVGKEHVEIVIAPSDFRRQPIAIPVGAPVWLPTLYDQIQRELARFPNERRPRAEACQFCGAVHSGL
jgi:hypothetical protein